MTQPCGVIGEGLLARTLDCAAWTHEVHLGATLWLLRDQPHIDVDARIATIIARYNESVGGVNDDIQGYHDTVTRTYLAGIRHHLMGRPPGESLAGAVNALLASPIGRQRLAAVILQRGSPIFGCDAAWFCRAPSRPATHTVLDGSSGIVTKGFPMSLLDGLLGQIAENVDVKNLAAKVGISPDQAEAAITALGHAHTAPGDTVTTAAQNTGLAPEILQQIVGHIGGEGSLGQFASLLTGADSGGMLGKLEGMAGGLFGKS